MATPALTALSAPSVSHPRLVRARTWEPPYDDSAWTGARTAQIQGALALAVSPLPLEATRSSQPEAPRLHLVRDLRDGDDEGRRPTGRGHLPAPGPWAGRLVQALVEVLAGDRPSAQLVRWTDEHVYGALRASTRPVAPGVATTRAALVPQRAQLRSLRVCEPDDGVAEISATVRRGERTTALALRLEGLDGRWVCTALELVGRRP